MTFLELLSFLAGIVGIFIVGVFVGHELGRRQAAIDMLPLIEKWKAEGDARLDALDVRARELEDR